VTRRSGCTRGGGRATTLAAGRRAPRGTDGSPALRRLGSAELVEPPAAAFETPCGSDGAVADAGGGALRAIAAEAGLERVRVVAWRDLEDPEAGGSELHAHRIASLWAGAGLQVELRTSAVPGSPQKVDRSGYRAVRRSGRYAVFPHIALHGLRHPPARGEALVEIWNGMPFWSPLWFRGPRLVFLHHVHAEMWRMVLPGWMARLGEATERRVAPPLYRSTRIVTLSRSARDEIVELLRLPPEQVSVVAPGVEPRFSPGPGRSPVPLVVAVGRLVPVKRYDLLMRSLARVKRDVPALQAVIIGEGYERPPLEELRQELGAADWLALPGRLDDDEVLQWYRRAWVVASTSLREGWGMTLTEAGACATPAVATDIAGHRDAVQHGDTGFLADGEEGVAQALRRLLADDVLRARMGRAALRRSRVLTWEETARATLEVLAEEAGWVPAASTGYPLRRLASRLP
jgi:glycosyltransferase involved in cell wall biosynthesis